MNELEKNTISAGIAQELGRTVTQLTAVQILISYTDVLPKDASEKLNSAIENFNAEIRNVASLILSK